MKIKFQIEMVFPITHRGLIIAAKCIEQEKSFVLTNNARLGNVKIKKEFGMPRALDKDGNPRFDLFFFHLKNKTDIDVLKEGQIVDLIPNYLDSI